MKLTRNVFLARSYLQQVCNKPWIDKPILQYIKLMDSLPLKERRKVQSDPVVKKLLKRVNS
jgi:hypothetical protein